MRCGPYWSRTLLRERNRAERSPGRERALEEVAVQEAAQRVWRGLPVGLAAVQAQQVDDLGVARPRDVRRDRDAGLAEALELGDVARDERVFEGAVLHAAQHPPDQRAVGQGDDGTARAALVEGGLEEPAQLELVAEGRDDLGRDVGRGGRVVVLGERVHVLRGGSAGWARRR